jgi:hypothetical protein
VDSSVCIGFERPVVVVDSALRHYSCFCCDDLCSVPAAPVAGPLPDPFFATPKPRLLANSPSREFVGEVGSPLPTKNIKKMLENAEDATPALKCDVKCLKIRELCTEHL